MFLFSTEKKKSKNQKSKNGIGKKNYAMSLHFKLVFILAISTANKQIYTTILNFVDTEMEEERFVWVRVSKS